MNTKFKKVLGIAVGLLIVIGLLTTVIPSISTNVTKLDTVSDEIVATGNGTQTVFDFTLERYPVVISGTNFLIWDDTEEFTDDGDGTLTGSVTGTGTIVYTTGVVQVTFATAVTDAESIYATYDVDDVPVLLRLIAQYWWIGLTIVVIALLMGKGSTKKLRKRFARR